VEQGALADFNAQTEGVVAKYWWEAQLVFNVDTLSEYTLKIVITGDGTITTINRG
jgi:hypothetical protein